MTDNFTRLPDADHIEGVVLEKGPTPHTSLVKIQYKSARIGLCEVAMTVPNALYLLTALEEMSADHGYDKLLRPPE